MNPLSVIFGLVRFLIMATRLVIFAVCLLPGFIRVALWYLRSANVKRNIKYGPRPRNYLDLYAPPPSPDTKHPVLVFISGGAWMSTSPRLLRPPPTRAPFPATPPFRAADFLTRRRREQLPAHHYAHTSTRPPVFSALPRLLGYAWACPYIPYMCGSQPTCNAKRVRSLFSPLPLLLSPPPISLSTLSSRQQGVGRSPWQGAQGTRRDVRDARLPEL